MNGAEHSFAKRPSMPESCPFCNGEGHVVALDPPDGSPRIFAVHCGACGAMAGHGSSEAQATEHWNIRAAASPASLANANTPTDTCAVAAQLVEVARGLYSGQLPPANALVSILVIPSGLQPSLGLHSFNVTTAAAANICAGAAQLFGAQAVPKTPGGILLPGQR